MTFMERSTKLLQQGLEAFMDAQQAVLQCTRDNDDAFYPLALQFEEAHQRYLSHLLSIAKGEAAPSVPSCVAAAGDAARLRYLAFFSQTKWTPSVLQLYHSHIENFLTWCHARGLASIADIDDAIVARYVAHLHRAGMKAATLKGRLSYLRRFLRWMVQGGILPESCLLGLKPRS